MPPIFHSLPIFSQERLSNLLQFLLAVLDVQPAIAAAEAGQSQALAVVTDPA